MFPWKCALPVLAIGALAACAQVPAQRGAAAVRADEEAAVNAVYQTLAQAAELAEGGMQQLRRGEREQAAQTWARTREALTLAAGRCANLRACEMERVLLAQDALLARQAEALLERSVDDGAAVGDAASAEQQPADAASPVLREVPESARAVALLKGHDLRSMIRVNEPIKAALEEWLTWMRPALLEAHENYQYLRYKMWPEYQKAGLPEALLFGILAKESGGKVHAVSRAGASGPLQFMYYTGARYGLGRENGFDMRFDAAAATRANVAYINDHLAIFNNDLELVLGAYNGGEGRMQRLSAKGSKRFWDRAVLASLPPETREYVPMVLAAAWLFLHPQEYNLKFPEVDGRPSEITLAQSASLNELSICLGQEGNLRGWFRTLRNLNPRYDPTVRLPAGTRLEMPVAATQAYSRSCLSGPLVGLAQDLQAARKLNDDVRLAQANAETRTHVVLRGETISSIARKWGCANLRGIATANRLKPPRYAIRAGQKLLVPGCRT